MEQGKIRPSVTLYSLDRSLPNLVRLITSATRTRMPILVEFGQVGNSPQIRYGSSFSRKTRINLEEVLPKFVFE